MKPDEPQNQNTASDFSRPVQPIQPIGQNMDVVPPPPETPTPASQPIQMPPYAPAQPPTSIENPELQPKDIGKPTPDSSPPAHQKTDILGILSIVSIFTGLLPVGLILGLVGASQAKKAHASPVVSRVGWILNLILLLAAIPVLIFLGINNYQTIKAKARDTERIQDLNQIESKLESFFGSNFGYPNSLDKIDITDQQILVGPSGTTIKISDVVADEKTAKSTGVPSISQEYIYIPYGRPNCTTTCDGYVLKGYVEKPSTSAKRSLVKLGLENL